MSIENIDKAYGSAYHKKNFPHLYQDNYLGSEEDIANRKEQGTYVPSEMYYTDEEKADRIGGEYFSDLLNELSSGLLLGGTQPKKYELQRGEDTETKLDDVFVDKYTGKVSYLEEVPKLGKYGIEIPGAYEYIQRAYRDESGEQVTIDPKLKAYTEERTDKTGSGAVSNALGVIMIPLDATGVFSLIKAGGKKLVGLVKNLLPNKSTDEISKILKNTLTDDIVTQIQNAPDKETQLNILQNNLTQTELVNDNFVEYSSEAKLILDNGKDLTSNTKPKSTGGRGIYKITPELSKELILLHEKGITSPAMLNRLIDGKVSVAGINKFLNRNNLKIEDIGSFKGRLQPTIDVKNQVVRFPNEQIKNAYVKDLKMLSSLSRQGLEPNTAYTPQFFKDKYFPFTTNLKSIDSYHDLVRKEFKIPRRIVDPKGAATRKNKNRKSSIKNISDPLIERQLSGTVDFQFHHTGSKKFNETATTKNTMYIDAGLNRRLRSAEIKVNKIYAAREKLIRQYVATGIKPEGYIKKLIKFNEDGIKVIENPEVFGNLNFKIFDPQTLEFYDFGVDVTKTLEGVYPTGKNIKDLAPQDIKIYQDEVQPGTSNDFFRKVNSLEKKEYLSKGGLIRKDFAVGTQPLQFDNSPIEIEDEDNFTDAQKLYIGQLTASLEQERQQAIVDRIENAPKSMQTALLTTLFDDESTQALEDFRNATVDERNQIKLSMEDVRRKVAGKLTPKLPVRYRLRSIPKFLNENIFFKKFKQQLNTGPLILGSIANDIQNKMSLDDPKTFEERYPILAKNLITPFASTEGTKDEDAYIDGILEVNRAIETGFSNLGYNTMDLVLSGIDLVSFGGTELSTKLRDLHDNRNINEPETFFGDLVAILTEYGIPGGLIAKITNRAQKAMRLKGFNTLPRYVTDDLSKGLLGASQLRQIGNVSKRMGTGAVVFGLTDAFSGGPYSSLKRMLPDDATLLPGKQEDTSGLTGNALIAANFRNRIRFGADGAAVGFLFPLLGPPIFSLIKGTAKLPFKGFLPGGYSVAGAGAKLIGAPFTGAADLLAGKIPFTSKLLPYNIDKIGVVGQVASKGVQAAAAFVGKQVATRALLGLGDVGRATKNLFNFSREDIITKAGKFKYSSTTFNRSLPDFQEWRNYTVNNLDPLHKALASIDNKLAVFRDIGKLTKNAFALSSEADLGIKAGGRAINKYLKQVEDTAYDMAKQFEERAQRYGEYETFQKKYLDDVLDYLQGKIKKNQLPPKIRDSAENLKAYTTEIKKDFKGLLPEEDELFKLLSQNIDKYMRSSFKVFTNADYNPDPKAAQKALQYIEELLKANPATKDQAKRFFPDLPLSKAVEEMAELKLADILKVARYESEDPLAALTKISKRLDPDTDLKLLTGEELPKVMRTYLGEEKDLRSSLLQTTGNILASTYQKTALDRIAVMGLENGWLFVDDIAAKNIGKMTNPSQLVDVKGSGFLPSDIIGTWGTPELVKQLSGYSIFDSLLKFKLYQNLIAFKAMVQGGKTLYSPATQMRNFGSAAFFALNSGHIGGSVGVTQGFKLVLDDIFGAGSKVEQEQMIKVLERKIKLGVLDENVQANELGAILRDLKNVPGQVTEGGAVISNFNQFTQKIGEGNISQTVQRLYAGGDNVWKFYGHEFYMSNLEGVIRTMDDVKSYYKNIMGRDFDPLSLLSGKEKTVAEGIEEIAAYLVRETYPTYSRVPPVIQALRKIPLGNFISFPAEIIRTSAQTTSLALKHIASDNAGLRAIGYRSLLGQFTTMYGFNQGISALSSYATGINQETLQAYTKRLGPDFMKDHALMAITAQDENGAFKAFDLSTYHPYDYIIAPVQSFLAEINRTKLDPDQIEGEVYNRYMNAFRPFFKTMEPFVSETLALEPFIDIWLRGGKASSGKVIFVSGPGGDDFGTKIEKSFNHAVETLSPGFVRTTDQVLGALKADIKGGKIMDLSDTIVKLLGGSVIDIDPKQALNYKARDIRDIRTNAFRGEIFFSKEQARGRNLPAEYEDIIKSALQGQFEMYMLFKDAMDTGLLTQEQIEEVLGPDGRNVPLLDNLIEGTFTPPSYAPKVLESRANELVNEYEKMGLYYDTYDFYPEFELDDVFDKYEDRPFSDFIDKTNEKEGNQYDYTSPFITVPGDIPDDEIPNFETPGFEIPDIPDYQIPDIPDYQIPDISQAAPPAAPLPESKPVNVTAAQPAAGVVNQATGLTSTESALLNRDEQLIRQRQRGTV